MPTFQHAIGQGRASCGWGSPLFRVEDEGDGRNDVRVAHTRPIVAKEPVELPSGLRCCRGDGTVRARERGDLWAPSAPPAYLPHAQAPCLPPRTIRGKFGL